MKINFSVIKKEAGIFGLSFLGDDAKFSNFLLLNIMASEGKRLLLIWKLLIVNFI